MKPSRNAYIGTSLLTCLLLAACQRSPPADNQATPPKAAAAEDQAGEPAAPRVPHEISPGRPDLALPARATTPVDTSITDVRLSDQGSAEDNRIGPPKSTFGPRDTVYAEVESQGTATSYTIYAKWIAADGTMLSDYGIKVNQAGTNRTVISLSKPDGWQPGENRIELAINGKAERTVTFVVR
jgi:hypothetical protein